MIWGFNQYEFKKYYDKNTIFPMSDTNWRIFKVNSYVNR